MAERDENNEHRPQNNKEIHEKPIKSENIFKSKISLALEDQTLEEIYNINTSSKINFINIVTSLVLIIYTIFCFLIFPNFSGAVTLYEKLITYLSIGISLSFVSLVISVLIHIRKRIFTNQIKYILEKSIMGVNYFILYTYLTLTFAVYNDLKTFDVDQVEIYQLLSIFSTIIKICYVVFFIKKFVITFITTGILFFSHIIIIKYSLTYKSGCPIISHILTLVICNIISYSNEVSEKINLFLLNKSNRINKFLGSNLVSNENSTSDSYRQICDNLKNSIITFDKSGNFSYANNSMKKLVISSGYVNSAILLNENDDEKLTKNKEKEDLYILSNNFNHLNIFMKNQINNNLNKMHTIGDIKETEEVQIYNSKFFSAVQTILNNLTYVNEELHFSNFKLFEYLNKLKNTNTFNLRDQDNLKTNSTQNKDNNIVLSEFIKLISNQNQNNQLDKDQANRMHGIRNQKTKLTDFIVTNRLEKDTYIKINDNSEMNILKDFPEKKESHNSIIFNNIKTYKSGFLNTVHNETLHGVLDRLKTKNLEFKEEYIYIGIVLMPGSQGQNKYQNSFTNKQKEDKEYYVYYIILPDGDIVFTFEDLSLQIKKERNETSNLCRSLYLSKFSHELKNPICNMLEIIEFLNQELIYEENKSRMRRENKFATHKHMLNREKKNLIFETSRDNSHRSDEISKNENNIFSYVKTYENKEDSESLDFRYRISKNVKLLKSIGDMMILIFKDFTFYSNLFGKDDIKPLIVNNFGGIKTQTQTQNFLSTTSINKSVGQFDDTASNHFTPYGNNSNFAMSNKICNYKEILTEVIQIFSNKSEIDNKSNKLSIDLNFENYLPDSIECDKDKFTSMIFNIFYHLYTTTVSGSIDVQVGFNYSSKLQDISSVKKIKFEIFVNGTTNFNLKNVTDGDILSGEFEENNLEEKENILNRNGGFETQNLFNENEFKNDLNKRNNSRRMSNNVIDSMQLKNILNIRNPQKRNTLVDKFNKNFQLFISQIYSNKLGIKINFTTTNKNKSKIFFQYDLPAKFDINEAMAKMVIDPNSENHKNKKINIINSSPVLISQKEKPISQFLNVPREGFMRSNSHRGTLCSFTENTLADVIPAPDTDRTEKISDNRTLYDNQINSNLNKLLTNKTEEAFGDSLLPISPDKFVINTGNIIINNKFYLDPKTLGDSFDSKKGIGYRNMNTDKNVIRFNEAKQPLKRLSNTVNFPRSKTRVKSQKSKSGLDSCTTFHKIDERNLRLSFGKVPRRSIENICRVILCDDENLIRKTLNRFLVTISNETPKLKFEIDHAENGYECLSHIYKSHNEGIYYDVLIIDETMPFIKGSQIIYLLKSMITDNALKNIIIVSFTSYDSPDKIEYIYSQGADYVITKPMKYEDFKIFFTEEILTNHNNNNISSDEEDEKE